MELKYDYKSDLMNIKIFSENDWCIIDNRYFGGNLTSLYLAVINLYSEERYHVYIDYYGKSLYALLMLHYYIISFLDSKDKFDELTFFIECFDEDFFDTGYNSIIIDYILKKTINDKDKYGKMIKQYIKENIDV